MKRETINILCVKKEMMDIMAWAAPVMDPLSSWDIKMRTA